jgi:uncharacterized protein YeaO (DUF488 family)
MFKTKSVHSKIEPRKDGLRILAARGRGRGLPSDRYDVWMANLGPSEQLRDAILAGNCASRMGSIAATSRSRITARNSR